MKNNKFTSFFPLFIALSVGAGAYLLWTVDEAVDSAEGETAVAANGLLHRSIYESALGTYDLGAHQTLSRVILLIRENYVEPERVKPYDMFLAALDYIEKTVPEVIVDTKNTPESVTVSVGDAEKVFEVKGLDQLWEVTLALRDIFRFMQVHVVSSTEPRDIEYAAINGMLSTLDPHSILLKPESFDEVKLSTKGEFGGLGIVISIRDGRLTIMSPIEGTPATRAGLKAKDVIVRIGQESTVNMSLEDAVSRLRGKPGSKVDIYIKRKTWTVPEKFELTRAIIKIESVTSELLADGIGYIRIKSFQGNTFGDLHSHLEALRMRLGTQLRGLVLDFRNNPGGLLDQAILISDRFIESGALVITVGEGNRKRDVKSAHFAGTETDYPIAVLVNAGSASASEIVAGALKNHDRATVIGEPTFGKGSVQVLYDFKDRSALKLTIAQYLTPGDVSIQSVGIRPDIELVPGSIEKEGIHLFANDLSPREKDLKQHLHRFEERKELTSASEYRLIHLLDSEKDKEKEVDAASDKFRTDFEIEFAQALLANSTGVRRSSVLQAGKKTIEAAALEQSKKIANRFKSLGVDWTAGVIKPKKAQARVSLAVVQGKKRRPIEAGDTIKLKATVSNTGTEPLHRVFGTTECENPFFRNLEFVFGYVPPGESKSWSVDVKLPKGMSSRLDGVTLSIADQYELLDDITAMALVNVREESKPRFAISHQIDDEASGNGDGLLQVGESVSLRVKVSNLGKGNASEVMLSAKNITGPQLFLGVGRAPMGAVDKGEHKQGFLEFELRKPVDEVKLRLSVWDTELGATFSDEIVIPVSAMITGKRTNLRSLRLRKAGEQIPIYGGASETSPVIAYGHPGAKLRSDKMYSNGWKRVRLHKYHRGKVAKGAKKKGAAKWVYGYVPKSDISSKKTKKAWYRRSFTPVQGQAAPFIKLDKLGLHAKGDTVQLKGIVGDERGLKDMYIFVNDSKVHYQAFEVASLTRNKAGEYTVPLDLWLPLEAGSNTVTLVVRENETLVHRKSFGLYREKLNVASNKSVGGSPTLR